jgi:iron complex outermembrane receptor protein
MSRSVARLTVLLVLVATASSPASRAQDGGDSGPAVLEEIIVKATRRAQNLQDVPMSVSAFTEEFFRDTGIRTLDALEAYTPSLRVQTRVDSRSTVLRGPQGTLYGKNTAAGAISIYTRKPVAEFEAGLEYTYDNDQRSELRGVVNIPVANTGHALRLAGFGNYGDHIYENEFADAAFADAAAEDLNDTNRWGGRGRFLLDLESTGDLLLTLDYTREDTDCCAIAVMSYNGLSTLNAPLTGNPSAERQQEYGMAVPPEQAPGGLSPNYPGYRLQYSAFEDTQGFSPPAADPFDDKYWFDGPSNNEVEVGGVALEWNRELGGEHELAFINAWRHYESDSAFDGDFSAYNAVGASTEVDLDQYSSELRIASNAGVTFEYQGGLYAYYSEFDSLGRYTMFPPLVQAIELDVIFPDGTLNTDDNTYTTTSFAVFGQLTWNIADQWSSSLGLRWTRERKEREGSQVTRGVNPALDMGNGSPIDIPPVAGPNITLDDERDDTDVSPTLSVRYFPTGGLMAYASISRGFKSGGFDQRRLLEGENGEFKDEESTSYEVGWKGTWMERRLQVNGTLFYVDYDDFQSQAFDGATFRVTNAGAMESYGLEIDSVFAFSEALIMGTAVGYTDATYDEFDNGQCTVVQAFERYFVAENAQYGAPATAGGSPVRSPPGTTPCAQDLGGSDVDNVPEWTVSSFLQYTMRMTAGLAMILRAEHNYIDGFYLDQDLDPNLKNDAIDLVNLRATLTNPDNDWEVALWGRNLLNEEYFAFGIDIPTVGGYGGTTAPDLSYGLTLRYNWY